MEVSEAQRLHYSPRRLGEETVERQRLRDENNMLRGRLRAMGKMGTTTVAAIIGAEEDGMVGDDVQGKGVDPEALRARVRVLKHSKIALRNSSMRTKA